MKISEGLKILELSMEVRGNRSKIYPTLIWDQQEAILVDTGIPGKWPMLRDAMSGAGVPLTRLDRVILTHQDFDHFGSLPQLLEDVNHRVEVLAHSAEKPYIEGNKPLLKMSPERLASILASFPPDQYQYAKELYRLRATINTTVEDGQVLPYCGGITVIHTPGHTPGHICLYLHQSKALIAGDALNVVEGKLQGPNPVFTPEPKQALESLRKLLEYEIESIICFHGGVYSQNVKESLPRLIAELS